MIPKRYKLINILALLGHRVNSNKGLFVWSFLWHKIQALTTCSWKRDSVNGGSNISVKRLLHILAVHYVRVNFESLKLTQSIIIKMSRERGCQISCITAELLTNRFTSEDQIIGVRHLLVTYQR